MTLAEYVVFQRGSVRRRCDTLRTARLVAVSDCVIEEHHVGEPCPACGATECGCSSDGRQAADELAGHHDLVSSLRGY